MKPSETKAMQDIRAILTQGGDPAQYRSGLASRSGLTVEAIDALIAAAGPARIVDAETVAQERLAEDRRLARTSAYRTYQHEEE